VAGIEPASPVGPANERVEEPVWDRLAKDLHRIKVGRGGVGRRSSSPTRRASHTATA
jgi:hypothetical protein